MSLTPDPVLTSADFVQIVAAAGRAPSVHNTQPWRFTHVESNAIELEVAAHRALRHSDPTGRELVVSCGTALHNLLVALRAHSLRGNVTPEPDPTRPLVVASIRIVASDPPTAAERREFIAIFHRHTHRQGFEAPISDTDLPEILAGEAATEGAVLTWVTAPDTRSRLIEIATEAQDRENSSYGLTSEREGWSNYDAGSEGVPPWAFAPRQRDPERQDTLPGRFVSSTRKSAVGLRPGTLGVLLTAGDGLADWLTAGRALQRLLLRATQDWAFAAFATPALETPELRDAIRVALDTAEYPQMLLEMGYAHVAATTRRRGTDEIALAGPS